MVKRISALAAVLLCVFMLCSCTASRSQIGAYVRGTLDSVYLNENSDEYLESVGGTAEECETQYQQYIRDEVEYFKMCMDIDEVSDATYQRLVKIFETLYAHCKYEVGVVRQLGRKLLRAVARRVYAHVHKRVFGEFRDSGPVARHGARRLAAHLPAQSWVVVYQFIEQRFGHWASAGVARTDE